MSPGRDIATQPVGCREVADDESTTVEVDDQPSGLCTALAGRPIDPNAQSHVGHRNTDLTDRHIWGDPTQHHPEQAAAGARDVPAPDSAETAGWAGAAAGPFRPALGFGGS